MTPIRGGLHVDDERTLVRVQVGDEEDAPAALLTPERARAFADHIRRLAGWIDHDE